jgi:uncharacterized protein (TIGR03437 family)
MLLLGASLFFLPHYSVTQSQQPASVVADALGNAYIVSADASNGWLTKLDTEGGVVYRVALSHAYPGGAIFATPDAQGNVYAAVGGYTPNSLQFEALKLDAAGNIVYHLPIGPPAGVYVRAPAVGTDGSAYFTGGAYPTAQTTPGAWVPLSGAAPNETNAFVIKVSPAGDRVIYSTYLDNSPPSTGAAPGYPVMSIGAAIAVDSSGSAYVTGITSDPGYPATPGAFQTQCPRCGVGESLFVTKLAPDGSGLSYSTYLGPADGALLLWGVDTRVDSGGSLGVVTVANGTSVRARTLRPDGSGLLLDNTIDTGSNPTASAGLVVAGDGQGNLIVSARSAQFNLAPSDGALQEGAAAVALLRAVDGAVLYSTRLPAAVGAANSRTITGVAGDGSGGFLVLSSAGRNGQSWTLTRFVPGTAVSPAIFGVANIAEANTSSALAPGELVSIQGTNLGPAQPMAAAYDKSSRLPFALGGTQVRFNGVDAPIVSVANQKVIAQVPFGIGSSGALKVELVQDGTAANSAEIPAADVEPQVLEGAPDGTGASYALAVNADGTLNSADHPAVGGSIVSVFLNGAGALTPSPADGMPGNASQRLVAPVSAVLATGQAGSMVPAVLFAGAAPGMVGLSQINLRIPAPPFPRPVQGASTLSIAIGNGSTSTLLWVVPQ